ncbi:MAG: FecR domain-containing protein [Bryobacterales bacterium]|nr:FecR domain-containing protein [Bryobacterales bacterium]
MDKFNESLNDIRNAEPQAGVETAAADRVRRNLFGAGSAGAGQLKGCDDFRTLFPSYLQKTISDARRMLLEDHVRECVHCRKALDIARGHAPKVVAMPVSTSPASLPKWAVAAMLLVGVGVAGFSARTWIPLFDGSPRATVSAIDGVLYQQTANGSLAIHEGAGLEDGEEVRTPANATAVIRLWDGSNVEMNERAMLSVSRTWRGTVIRLDRGQIIVRAAKQKQGKLFVATGDSEVSVVGTIFSVNRGTLGSRVSVVEGRVEVRHNGQMAALQPGQQASTHRALAKVAVASEVAWSRDAATYLALLGELSALQKQLETLPPNGLRYQSTLLMYMPEDTKLFASIPNFGVTLTEAKKIFDERLAFSGVLQQWWNSKQNARAKEEVERLIDLLKELSSYIGEEIVVFVTGDRDENAVVMTDVKDAAGLQAFLHRKLPGHERLPFAVEAGKLIVGGSAERVARVKATLARGAASTPFRQRIEHAYADGAGWLMVANMEQIFGESVSKSDKSEERALGLNTVQYLVLERRDIGGKTENRASLTFTGERKGVASWLAAPAAMSTLGFVSPEAGAAASFVVKQPRAMVEELFSMIRATDPAFDNGLARLRQETGIDPLEDLAAPLGSEFTFAIDGPLLPLPSWKLAVEVNQPQRFQASLEKVIEVGSREAAAHNVPVPQLSQETVNGRVFYKIAGGRLPLEIHYTYVDSYLLAGADRTLLTQAMQNRTNGFTLASSDRFRSQLPYTTNPNFSAVLYHNFGGMLGPVVDQLDGLLKLSPDQKASLAAMRTAQPGLIAAYAEKDRITAGTTGTFFGLNLGMLASGNLMQWRAAIPSALPK